MSRGGPSSAGPSSAISTAASWCRTRSCWTWSGEALVDGQAAGGGYVLDGVPRTMAQARAIYQIGLELDMTANVALHLRPTTRS